MRRTDIARRHEREGRRDGRDGRDGRRCIGAVEAAGRAEELAESAAHRGEPASRISAPSATELTGICGTPVYMAPEMLRGEAYGASVDVWALGVLVYVLLLGGWPYMPPAPTAEDHGGVACYMAACLAPSW